MFKTVSIVMIILIFINMFLPGFVGRQRVEAGFWSDNQENIITLIKGIIILWILNIIRNNDSSGSDNFISSTIQKGLDFTGFR